MGNDLRAHALEFRLDSARNKAPLIGLWLNQKHFPQNSDILKLSWEIGEATINFKSGKTFSLQKDDIASVEIYGLFFPCRGRLCFCNGAEISALDSLSDLHSAMFSNIRDRNAKHALIPPAEVLLKFLEDGDWLRPYGESFLPRWEDSFALKMLNERGKITTEDLVKATGKARNTVTTRLQNFGFEKVRDEYQFTTPQAAFSAYQTVAFTKARGRPKGSKKIKSDE